MEDQTESPEGADREEDVSEDQQEGLEAQDDEESEGETEGQADDTGDEKPEKPRETSKERRAREKEYKAHLREQAKAARAEADAAKERRDRILQAGQRRAAPKEEEFKDFTEFVAVRAVWEHARENAQISADEEDGKASEAQKRAEAFQQEERRLLAAEWQSKISDAKSRYSDFEAVALNPTTPISDDVASLIMSLDNAADVAYAIGKDHALARDLSAMQPMEAAHAILQVGASIAPPARKTSQAPAPISPVKGGAAPARDPAKMSQSQYAKWRDKGGTY